MSNYRIEFLKTAKKELAKLPKEIQQRIANRIEALIVDPYPVHTKKLKNGNGLLRIRVGDYRIIYRVEAEKLIILVIKIGHRRDIYTQI
ncbi:type II toxin-antitoxin system RelE/ParE family toxin [Synechococcus sp. PCC 6312]|uniref:type II toxin-antitoxin system RelE family toxin n=1 Tax=Synechococcus sp. (strain ATCC 27167 / PCC 6312) TaxID=195253 RepID=UPI00029F19A7|nr:type II toxin-antitoxin system RelE/ParE family toxin [Synechococcus sp. PCC 6312]AFY60372.1 addiction module toxin, RelE/StbE family [Synechococcus sp. PCC 6312]